MLGGGGDHHVGQRRNEAGAGTVIVRGDHAEDEDKAAAGEHRFQRLPQGAQRGRIVGHVDHHIRAFSHHLDACRPPHRGQAAPNPAGREGDAALGQDFRGRHRGGSVRELVRTHQWKPQATVVAPRSGHLEDLVVQCGLQGLPAHHLIDERELRLVPRTDIDDRRQRLGTLRGTDDGSPGTDDPCLLPRNLIEGAPEHIHMVVAHGRNHRHDGFRDVGGIQPPAQAYLHDCQIGPGAREV